MEVKLAEFCSNADGLKKSPSFENLILLALNLKASSPTEESQPLLSKVSTNIIQENDHEIRLAKAMRPALEITDVNKYLYRALTCNEIKKMFATNMTLLNKVTQSNSCAQFYKTNIRTFDETWVMIADEDLDLDDESEADCENGFPFGRSCVNEEVDLLVPKSYTDEDATTLKHVMITDELKFHCKLCGFFMDTYTDVFLHLVEDLHQKRTVKEERRLDFVYHQNLLLKVKRVRELLAEEGNHIAILQGESYNCKLCDKCFSCEVDVFVHMTSLKHQLAKVKQERQCSMNKVWELLEQNKVLQHGGCWQCMVCSKTHDCPSDMVLAEAIMHIKRDTHKDHLMKKQTEVGETSTQLVKSSGFSSGGKNEDIVGNMRSKMNDSKKNLVVHENKESTDELPMNQLQMTKEENEVLQNKIFSEEYKFILYMCEDIYYCKLCATFVSAYGVDYHVFNKSHSQALEEKTIVLARLWFIVRLLEQGNFGNVKVDCVDPCQFECRLCSIKCLQMEDVLVHVASEDHMANLRSGLVQYQKLSEESLMCRVCKTTVESRDYAVHVRSESHQAMLSKHVFGLQLKQRQEKLFCKLPEILRMHEEYFRPVSDEETRCILCKCNMPLAADDIWAHINDSYHISHMNFYLQKTLSNCEITDDGTILESQNENLESDLNHTESDTNISCHSDEVSQFELSCFNNEHNSEESPQHFSIDCSNIFTRLCVLPCSIQTMLSSHGNFSKHCQELCALSGNSYLEVQNSQIISMLELTFRPVFPDCNVIIFGSRMAGFAVDSNDIDIYLDVGTSKLQSHEHHISQRLFVRMGYRLLSNRQDCKNLKEVPYARTPIIRFTYLPLTIDCDLNFMNDMSVQNTKLVRFYSMLDERVKMLILLVRHWARSTGATRLGTSAKISNYALTLLTIFYLQQLDEPVVPTVEVLQSHHVGEKKFVRGWNCSFLEELSALPQTHNTKCTAELLSDFFVFYGNMEFSQAVLCPHCGRSMSRRAFLQWMGRQQTNSGQWEKFRIKSPMCVQDPLDLSHNVTKGVTEKCMISFQLTCRASAALASKLCEAKV